MVRLEEISAIMESNGNTYWGLLTWIAKALQILLFKTEHIS